MGTTSFISTKVATELLKALTRVLKNNIDNRNSELIRINDVFGDCQVLAKFYIQPDNRLTLQMSLKMKRYHQ